MAKRPHYGHLRGDPGLLPYGARSGLRRRQRRWARVLGLAGAALLGLALLLLARQTLGHGGQPAPPLPPQSTPRHPAAVDIRLATSDLDTDVLAGTDAADTAARASLPPQPAAGTPAPVLAQYADLYAQNPDLVGWLCIDDTGIDYPVVQVPNDNETYLRRGFDRLYAQGGTLFLDGRCRLGPDGATANWLLYGHNMPDDTMFGTLDAYADEGFYRAHPTFRFDTIYETGKWQVVAVLRTTLGADPYPYYAFFDAADEGEWQAWMDQILPLALYDTGVAPVYGRQLLTLSTCGDRRPGTDARLAVLAMRAE